MPTLRNDRIGPFVPVTLAAIIAVVGIAVMFFTDFGQQNGVQGNAINMITAAAVDRAGATVSESPAH